MCKIVNLLVLVVILVAGYSCTQSLDEIPESFETLKDLDIKWRKNVSESKKNVIRDILNDMVYVEGGLFLMGATNEQGIYARNNERPAHYVRLSSFYMGFGCGTSPSTDPSVSKGAKIRREPSDFSHLFRQLPSKEGSPFSLRPLMIRHITYPFHLNVPSAVRLRARGQMASLL